MQQDVLDLLRKNEKQLLDNWLTKQTSAFGAADQSDLRRQADDLIQTLFQSLAADPNMSADSPTMQPYSTV